MEARLKNKIQDDAINSLPKSVAVKSPATVYSKHGGWVQARRLENKEPSKNV